MKFLEDFRGEYLEPQKRTHSPLLAAGLASKSKNSKLPYGRRFPAACCGELQYDIKRQLELESYGYHFLRINKFSLLPKEHGQTKVDVLNDLLASAFAS